jgi:hypothetical protein
VYFVTRAADIAAFLLEWLFVDLLVVALLFIVVFALLS